MPEPGEGSDDVHANLEVAFELGSGGVWVNVGVSGGTLSTASAEEPVEAGRAGAEVAAGAVAAGAVFGLEALGVRACGAGGVELAFAARGPLAFSSRATPSASRPSRINARTAILLAPLFCFRLM